MSGLIYPPLTHETDSATIFFIGNAKESLYINDQEIELICAGNFCPVLNLSMGENKFKLCLDGESSQVEITRKEKSTRKEEYEFREYSGGTVSDSFKKICLDPGHGGEANGTKSPKGILEKNLNLDLCLQIKKELEKASFEVFLTRDDDRSLSLEERVLISKNNQCDLFLSVHHNAIPDHLKPMEHYGISTHYYYEHSLELAKELTNFLSASLGLKNNSAIQQNLYVTRENQDSKAILLECGFLIHPVESEILVKPEFQVDLAKCLVEFLSKFLKNS